jgi:hypothetical protein
METKHYSTRKRAPIARKLFEDEGTDDKKYRELSRLEILGSILSATEKITLHSIFVVACGSIYTHAHVQIYLINIMAVHKHIRRV